MKRPEVKRPVVKDWQCLECGKRMTAARAERAMFGPTGCPSCGGSDIDIYVPEGTKEVSHAD